MPSGGVTLAGLGSKSNENVWNRAEGPRGVTITIYVWRRIGSQSTSFHHNSCKLVVSVLRLLHSTPIPSIIYWMFRHKNNLESLSLSNFDTNYAQLDWEKARDAGSIFDWGILRTPQLERDQETFKNIGFKYILFAGQSVQQCWHRPLLTSYKHNLDIKTFAGRGCENPAIKEIRAALLK